MGGKALGELWIVLPQGEVVALAGVVLEWSAPRGDAGAPAEVWLDHRMGVAVLGDGVPKW